LPSMRRLKVRGSLRSDDRMTPPRVEFSEITISAPLSAFGGADQIRQAMKATKPISRTLSNARDCRFTFRPVGQFIGRFFSVQTSRNFCDLCAVPYFFLKTPTG
jgi:hypothetical protein